MPFRSACSSANTELMGLLCFEDFLHLPINMLIYFPILFFSLSDNSKNAIMSLITRDMKEYRKNNF